DGGAHALEGGERGGERRAGEDDADLLAAVAGGPVGVAQRTADPRRGVGEHAVAGRPAVLLVDLAEVVDVEQAEREWLVGRVRLLDLEGEPAVEVAARVQAGERVDVDLRAQVLEHAAAAPRDHGGATRARE